jgi:SAM-dependent methyltransferase
MRMLREIHRVLRSGGWLIFRANNLDAPRRRPFAFPAAAGTGLRTRLSALGRYLRGIAHHLRTRRYESRGGGYEVAGDPYFDYALLSYYIQRDAQVRQLEDLGFSAVEVLGINGTPLAGGVCSDPFLFYIASRSD